MRWINQRYYRNFLKEMFNVWNTKRLLNNKLKTKGYLRV